MLLTRDEEQERSHEREGRRGGGSGVDSEREEEFLEEVEVLNFFSAPQSIVQKAAFHFLARALPPSLSFFLSERERETLPP